MGIQSGARDVYSWMGFGGRGNQAPGADQGAGGETTYRDPFTGYYVDPTTGTMFKPTSGTGPNAITDPNVAQQVAADNQRQQVFLNALAGNNAERQAGIGGQNSLAAYMNGTLHGGTPSLAGMQLSQGLDQIGAQQEAQAAGTSGAASPLAQMMAMRNTGAASVGMNNSAAMARVAEQNNAQTALASLYNSQVVNANTNYGQNVVGAHGYADLSLSGQEKQQDLIAGKNQQQDKRMKDYMNATSSFIGSA